MTTETNKYAFTPLMGEISGFGGGYEQACRDMLKAGMLWLDAHPEANPKFSGYKGVYGLINEENDDAKALSAALLEAAPDCSGAMHHAVTMHCMAIKTHGWAYYVAKMSEKDPEETAH